MRTLLVLVFVGLCSCASHAAPPSSPAPVTAEDLCGRTCTAEDVVACAVGSGPCECPDPCSERLRVMR